MLQQINRPCVRAQPQCLAQHGVPARPTHRRSPPSLHAQQDAESQLRRTMSKLAGLVATAVVLTGPGTVAPAAAEIQTVPAAQVTQMAKALPQQKVDKGRVWAVCLGGAAVLFVGTVVAENNEAWFPAIARANKAMAMNRKREQKQQQNS